ncbi:DUF2252 family protein [Alkalicoccobacillus murimartini]|uniref:Uncharacterized protein (DUF2252 family)/Leucine-rich repeat (LRR) protein n=1 Tax=Alkalicoccobacillus murimartini TaxID=171685 RepID=A0ABT9YMS1_9BACI|nr:DUF2252 family protein [Alkalicoccobacillus murimartini]MDQ0208497.1 uncharacterized protein (DUF2252 family)/Leucine-rich repeat (LRR) protein [Alkalicoccobacillus murimartini]
MKVNRLTVFHLAVLGGLTVFSPSIAGAEQLEDSKETYEEMATTEVEEVHIQDESLKEVLIENVKLNGFDQLTKESLEGLTEIEGADGRNIKDLSGLEFAINLEKIDLSNNQIQDLSPLKRLTEVKDLKLESNQITNIESLSTFIQLTKLNLRTNSVKDLSPLSDLIHLEKLDVRENGLSSIDVVSNLKALKELNLRENAVTNLEPISGLTELIELNIHTNQISDITPLTNLTKLEVITMRRNQISDISVLANLPLLKDLNLRDNQITSIEALANHQFLTVRLNLRDNPGLIDLSPVASYYDQIEDVDFVIPKDDSKDLSDLDLLDGEERSNTLTKRLIENNRYIQDRDVRNTKFSLLQASPFSFYRGTAHLFFEDAANDGLIVPNEWSAPPSLHTWITGDLHNENIGFYGNGKNEAIFDFNDFDEVAVAPYYYDLLRFGTSLYLLNDVAPALQFDHENMREALVSYSTYYKEALEEVNSQQIQVDDFRFTSDQLSGYVGETAADIASIDRFSELGRWTKIVDGERLLDPSNARLAELDETQKEEIKSHWQTYVSGINESILSDVGAEYFEVKDIARRTDAGLGSLGTERYYVLIEGATSGQQDDIILDVKTQLPSAVDRAGMGQTPSYATHADRTMAGMSALHNYPDIHWGSLQIDNQSFLVKERSAYKDEFDQSSFSNREDFDSFLFYSAKASAYAHVRAANSLGHSEFAQQAYTLMDRDTFDQEFADLSLHYYGQTLKDHEIYAQLYSNGAFSDQAFEPIEDKPEEEDPTDQPGDKPEEEDPTDQPGDKPEEEEPIDQPGDKPEEEDPTDQPGDKPEEEDPTDQPGDKPKEENPTDQIGDNKQNDDSDQTEPKKEPIDVNKQPAPTPTKAQDKDGNGQTPSKMGGLMPETATQMFGYLAVGLALVSLGVIVYIIQRKRRANSID